LTTTIGSVTTNLLIPPEPVSEVKFCDNSLRFAERPFIRMMTRIMQVAIANPLPIPFKEEKFGILLYNAGLG
jgi:hypothetical protein